MKKFTSLIILSLLATTCIVEAGRKTKDSVDQSARKKKSRSKSSAKKSFRLQEDQEQILAVMEKNAQAAGKPFDLEYIVDHELYAALDDQTIHYVLAHFLDEGGPLSQNDNKRRFIVQPIDGNQPGQVDIIQNTYLGRALMRYNVKGDGDCLFYALQQTRAQVIADLIDKVFIPSPKALQIRDILRPAILEDLDRAADAVDPTINVTDDEVRKFLEKFKIVGRWAPYEIAIAHGVSQNKNVFVWNFLPHNQLTLRGVSSTNQPETLHVGFSTSHYQQLVLEGEANTQAQQAISYLVEKRKRKRTGSKRLFLTAEERANPVPYIETENALADAGDGFTGKFYPLFNTKLYRQSVGNTKQYKDIHMPEVPCVHHYNLGSSRPTFLFAAQASEDELGLLPNIKEVLSLIDRTHYNPKHGFDQSDLEYFINVQNSPKPRDPNINPNENPLCLRPQPWVWPDAPNTSKLPYGKAGYLDVAVLSDGSVNLLRGEGGKIQGNGQFQTVPFSVHNDKEDPHVVSSGALPVIVGIEENKSSLFYSIVTNPLSKKIAITLHAVLDDKKLDELKKEAPTSIEKLIALLPKFDIKGVGQLEDSVVIPEGYDKLILSLKGPRSVDLTFLNMFTGKYSFTTHNVPDGFGIAMNKGRLEVRPDIPFVDIQDDARNIYVQLFNGDRSVVLTKSSGLQEFELESPYPVLYPGQHAEHPSLVVSAPKLINSGTLKALDLHFTGDELCNEGHIISPYPVQFGKKGTLVTNSNLLKIPTFEGENIRLNDLNFDYDGLSIDAASPESLGISLKNLQMGTINPFRFNLSKNTGVKWRSGNWVLVPDSNYVDIEEKDINVKLERYESGLVVRVCEGLKSFKIRCNSTVSYPGQLTNIPEFTVSAPKLINNGTLDVGALKYYGTELENNGHILITSPVEMIDGTILTDKGLIKYSVPRDK